jgi:hypothetical protein
MHVEGQLALTLQLLLLGRDRSVALGLETLGQQLLDTTSSRDILQAGLSLPNHSLAESAETQLDHSAVVQDLGSDIGLVNGLLQMGHQQHVTGHKETVVKGMVVDVAQHSTGALQRVGILVQIHAEIVDQAGGVGDGLGDALGEKRDGGILNSDNDNIGLKDSSKKRKVDDRKNNRLLV